MAKKEFEEKEVAHLAECVIWALEFLKTTGSGLMASQDGKNIRTWQSDFIQALKPFGIVVDEKAYWEQKNGKKKKAGRK